MEAWTYVAPSPGWTLPASFTIAQAKPGDPIFVMVRGAPIVTDDGTTQPGVEMGVPVPYDVLAEAFTLKPGKEPVGVTHSNVVGPEDGASLFECVVGTAGFASITLSALDIEGETLDSTDVVVPADALAVFGAKLAAVFTPEEAPEEESAVAADSAPVVESPAAPAAARRKSEKRLGARH